MKIIFLSDDFPPSSFGGAGIVAYNIAQALKGLGHHVSIITTTQDKNAEGFVVQDGLRVFKIYSYYHSRWRAYMSLYNPDTVRKAAKVIAHIEPDVVHVHNIHHYLSYYLLKIAKASGARVVLTAHDTMLYSYGKVAHHSKISPLSILKRFKWRYNPFRNIVIRHYLKYVDKIISISNVLKQALDNNRISNNVETIYNGIDLAGWVAFDESITQFKKRYNLEGKKVVLFSGRLSGAKGGEKIVQVMRHVIKNIPEAVLLIVGREDSYTESLKNIASQGGYLPHLIFTGWLGQDEIKSAYFCSDVVAVLSIYLDPFGLVNLEAMAAKKPVIGTCYGGTREIVVDNDTGYIVDPNDIDIVSQRIIKLLINPSLAQSMGERGYERAKNYFDSKEQIDKYIKAYTS